MFQANMYTRKIQSNPNIISSKKKQKIKFTKRFNNKQELTLENIKENKTRTT